jgi:hypothetical protein
MRRALRRMAGEQRAEPRQDEIVVRAPNAACQASKYGADSS